MSNLDFIAGWDIGEFKRQCIAHREVARRFPAYDKEMATLDDYHWILGDWSLSFLLETWAKPVWHGSVAVLDVPYKVNTIIRVDLPAPQPLWTKDWDEDHFKQARFLLAEMFGPILRPGDKSQHATDTVGPMALHWHVPPG